jgi:chromosome segregation ATPase
MIVIKSSQSEGEVAGGRKRIRIKYLLPCYISRNPFFPGLVSESSFNPIALLKEISRLKQLEEHSGKNASNSAQAQYSPHQNRESTIQARIDDSNFVLQEEIATLSVKIGALESENSALRSRISSLEADSVAVVRENAKSADLKVQVDALQEKIKAYEAKIAFLNQEGSSGSAALKSEIDSLKQNIASMENEIRSAHNLKGRFEQLQQDNKELTESLDDLHGKNQVLAQKHRDALRTASTVAKVFAN